MTTQTWLITGASTGLGRTLAEHVLQEGDSAVVAARDFGTLPKLAAPYPDQALPVHALPPHWLILGSDAYRRMSAKLQAFLEEFENNRDVAPTTDYLDAGKAVL